MLGSQRGRGTLWQLRLAHLLGDATYAIECGGTAFSAPIQASAATPYHTIAIPALIGWIPAAIWAAYAVSQYHTDQNTQRAVEPG